MLKGRFQCDRLAVHVAEIDGEPFGYRLEVNIRASDIQRDGPAADLQMTFLAAAFDMSEDRPPPDAEGMPADKMRRLAPGVYSTAAGVIQLNISERLGPGRTGEAIAQMVRNVLGHLGPYFPGIKPETIVYTPADPTVPPSAGDGPADPDPDGESPDPGN